VQYPLKVKVIQT